MAPTSVSPEFDKVGYWSPNTASVDWYENNYVVTPYIADLYVNGVSPETILPLNPQFHAWWHCFSRIEVYSASVLVIYYHHDIRNEHPSLYLWKGFFPALSVPSSKAKSQ
ncbi:hypothetical protein BGZ74_003563 [Mortierella antarctica]|nr:hypothetical protein BGZ74_003563 [Mortierella antarctica]